MDLSGNMTRQVEQDMPVEDDSSHVVNIGKLVEDMELKMRNLLRMLFLKFDSLLLSTNACVEEVYFGKAKDVVGDLRSKSILHQMFLLLLTVVAGILPLTQANRDRAIHAEMIGGMQRR